MTAAPAGWRVEHHEGGAAALHRLDPPDSGVRTARVLRVTRPALVLGSAQRVEMVRDDRVAAAGCDVVTRRSGGGAVLLGVDDHVWVDLFVPRDDALWDDDVAAASWWAGEAWVRALTRGEHRRLTVHRAGLGDRELGRTVCFAAVGPGEVLAAGRKVVGVSQRRTRDWTRLQTVAYIGGDLAGVVELLRVDAATGSRLRTALEQRATTAVTPGCDDLVGSVVEALPSA